MTLPIQISLQGSKVIVKPDSYTVAAKGETVEWQCDDGGFAVVFGPATPFDKPGFTGSKGQRNGSPPRADAAAGTYKYTVVVAHGDEAYVADPQVIIP